MVRAAHHKLPGPSCQTSTPKVPYFIPPVFHQGRAGSRHSSSVSLASPWQTTLYSRPHASVPAFGTLGDSPKAPHMTAARNSHSALWLAAAALHICARCSAPLALPPLPLLPLLPSPSPPPVVGFGSGSFSSFGAEGGGPASGVPREEGSPMTVIDGVQAAAVEPIDGSSGSSCRRTHYHPLYLSRSGPGTTSVHRKSPAKAQGLTPGSED
jgi:hypothetical protein